MFRSRGPLKRLCSPGSAAVVALATGLLFCSRVVCAGSEDEVAVLERLGAEACQALERVFAYDPAIPLASRIVEQRERDGRVREKIVFRGARGFWVPGTSSGSRRLNRSLACCYCTAGRDRVKPGGKTATM
jgi:hypothetical protein